jgi:hypothetical protein
MKTAFFVSVTDVTQHLISLIVPIVLAKLSNAVSVKKVGHYDRCCRAKTVSEVTTAVNEAEDLDVLAVSTGNTQRLKSTYKVTVNDQQKDVEFVLDTGSSVTIMNEKVMRENFPNASLIAAPLKLVSYSGQQLDVIGCLQAEKTGKHVCNVKVNIYIVRSGTTLLGMDMITALNVKIAGGTVHTAESECPKFQCIKGFVHKIKVNTDIKPVQQKLHRLPLSVRDAVADEVQRMLREGIIERIEASPWVSQLVVTKKKTGGIRVCCDLREPNKAIIVPSYPLPVIDELLSELRGSVMWSRLDMRAAYHQCLLHEDGRDLTAFITHDGLFRYCRIPNGLASGPAVFARMMSTILKGLPGVQCFFDDLVTYGSSPEEHEVNLKAVLHRLNEYNVQLNWSKCEFRKKKSIS